MRLNSLRRWSRPKTILVVSDLFENPAHTLQVIGGIRTTGAKAVLVQIPCPDYALCRDTRGLRVVPPPTGDRRATDQSFLRAEILSEVTVLRNTPLQRIPALAESLGAEMVVLTKAEIGRMPFPADNAIEADLFGSLRIPIMSCGARSNIGSWNAHALHKILVPIALRPGLGLQMRFACRFARRHHGRITVLHVFESANPASQPWERTPVAVEARLPIAELKQEGILCPLEIAICEGYPDRKILAFNEQKPHNLIIMGGSGRKRSAQSFGRSVTDAVIAEARCPVLTLNGPIMADWAGLAESGSHLGLIQDGQLGD